MNGFLERFRHGPGNPDLEPAHFLEPFFATPRLAWTDVWRNEKTVKENSERKKRAKMNAVETFTGGVLLPLSLATWLFPRAGFGRQRFSARLGNLEALG